MENVLLWKKKKKSAELNTKISDVIDVHSGTSFLFCHVQKTVPVSEDHTWSGPVLDKLFCLLWTIDVKGVYSWQGDHLGGVGK